MKWREAAIWAVVTFGLGVLGACGVNANGIGMLNDADAAGGADGGADRGAAGGEVGIGDADDSWPVEAGSEVNYGEPVDGPVYLARNGSACSGAGGCASDYCVDGFCCDYRCGGICVACGSDRTGQPDGQCRPILMGTDPEDECVPESSVCGRSGACSGNGSCALASAGLVCGEPVCLGRVATPPPRCTGSGTCEAQPGGVCAGQLRCGEKVCNRTCAGDGDCVDGSACDTVSGTCGTPRPNGAACDSGAGGRDCGSGHCSDGFCCDSACGGSCQGCSLARTGVASGICAPLPAGQDPDDECDAEASSICGNDGSCDGAGACRRYPDGTICERDCCGGNGNRLCEYACRAGSCDTSTSVTQTQCGASASTCCCPNPPPGGGPVCTAKSACTGGCAN
jgi:hypothetical protein